MIELVDTAVRIFGMLLLCVGAACAIIGAMGILRFPDVYNRLHAQTVAIVGGAVLILLAVALLEGTNFAFSIKSVIIAIFIFITGPVGSHAIARAAHKSGVKLWKGSVADKLSEEKPWNGKS